MPAFVKSESSMPVLVSPESMEETWGKKPEDKVKLAARTTARWKIAEQKDALLKNKVFRRDDNDPKMKMRWDKMKKEANLNADELRVQYHNAFIHLHLDASHYDFKFD